MHSIPLTRIALSAMATLLAAIPVAAQTLTDLDARLRNLEKQIAAVRGLAFKSPVQAKIIPRPTNATKGLQGYYQIKDKTLYLYGDVKNSYQQGVLIHEMVHALQDQHFDLGKLKARLHVDKHDDDAALALAALIEGDATFTMIEVLKKDQPKVAAMLDAPLEKSKNLQNAFLYAQGARYVKALKERGGWASVNFAYKFPPDSTAAIFSLRSVASIDLGPGATRGAFALFNELIATPETRPHAMQAARGWRGDRLIVHKSGKAWVHACADADSGHALHAALQAMYERRPRINESSGQGYPGKTWIAADGAMYGAISARGGKRVYRLEATDAKAYRDLLEAIEGPLKLSVLCTKDKKSISFGAFIERLLDADIVCIGESHDADLHHRVQLQIIKGLFANDERLGVGMEMFQRPFQKELDRYVAGQSDDAALLKASEYPKRWGYDWSLYQPIADFCKKNQLPLAALNASKELTGRISKVGFAGLNDMEKKQLGEVDFQLKPHRDYWYERLAKLHGSGVKRTPEQKERSYQVMTVWDDYMAASAALFQQERRLRRMIVLAGSGHIERGFGIPLRAARRIGGKALTVKIVVGPEAVGAVVTDFVVIVQ